MRRAHGKRRFLGRRVLLTLSAAVEVGWGYGTASASAINWTGGGDGSSWTDSDNWSSSPSSVSPGDDLTFGSGTVSTIDLGGDQVANSITFNAGFTLGTAGTGDSLSDTTGDITDNSSATPTINAALTGNSTLTISGSGGSLVLNGAIAPTESLDVNDCNVSIGPTSGSGNLARTLSSISISNQGEISLDDSSNIALVTSSLTLGGSKGNWSGLLDLEGKDLIVHNASSSAALTEIERLTNQIGEGGDTGHWDGTAGIITKFSVPTLSYGLAPILNRSANGAPYTNSFDGQALTTTDIVVRTLLYGDANGDGKIDGDDYTIIDNTFNDEPNPLAASTDTTDDSFIGWQDGDFNYDGIVNGDDYTLIDNGFNTQYAGSAGISTAIVATGTSQIATGTQSSVPEPASSYVLAIGVAGLLVRRRHRLPAMVA